MEYLIASSFECTGEFLLAMKLMSQFANIFYSINTAVTLFITFREILPK